MKKITIFLFAMILNLAIAYCQTNVTTTGGTSGYLPKFTGSYTILNSNVFDNSGNIGIGTTSAGSLLSINDTKNATYSSSASPTTSSTISNNNNSLTNLEYSSLGFFVSSQTSGAVSAGYITLIQPAYTGKYGNFAFTLRNSAGNFNEIMRIQSDGYVGIGTTSPGANLQINGSSGTTLKIVDGNQGLGKILISDANGVASWGTSVNGLAWSLTGNSGTTAGTNFMGTTDDIDVVFKRNNVQSGLLNNSLGNTSWGVSALNPSTTGSLNTAIGYQSLYSNTAANNNTAIGYQSLYTQSYNGGGSAWDTYNVAVGNYALYSNQPATVSNGNCNTALGWSALYSNTTGNTNTANGTRVLYFNTTGNANTANGYNALYSNTTGTDNTSTGVYALNFNTSGNYNTAYGNEALYTNTTGGYNTATGFDALYLNTSGSENTAIGIYTLYNNTTGSYNTALGYNAGNNYATCSNCIFVGYNANASSNYSNAAAIGKGTSVGGDGATALGYNATSSAANRIYIGTSANSLKVGGYDTWQQFSDGRFKENIITDVPGLSFITKLRPVTFTVNTVKLDSFMGIKQRMDTIPDLTEKTDITYV